MKLIQKTFIHLAAVMMAVCSVSCEKGKDIVDPGFGKLAVFSTFDSDAKPLLVKIDGETKDTLKALNPSALGIVLVAGTHKVQIVDAENKTLMSVDVPIEAKKIFTLSRFWYHESSLVFDSYDPVTMPKPASGKVLVRFITTREELPADMRLEFIAAYKNGRTTYKFPTEKVIAHVKKDQFSDYIELPDPRTFYTTDLPGYYILEGIDNVTGAKVMGGGIGGSAGNQLTFGNSIIFQPNTVLSQAINAVDGNETIFLKPL